MRRGRIGRLPFRPLRLRRLMLKQAIARLGYARCVEGQRNVRIEPPEIKGDVSELGQPQGQRLRPEYGDLCSWRDGDGLALMVEARLARNLIDRERDPMPDAAGLDQGNARLAGERVIHREQRLKRVALLTSRRTHVG